MILVGISLTGALRDQRVLLVQKFTYPLFMSEGMTAGSPRVQDFIQSLASTGISGNIDYVTKEEALDKEVQKNPGILSALNGENPLPDVIMIPLYWADLTTLWTRIQEYRDLFDSVQSSDSLRSRLKKFENSLQEIDHLVRIIMVFVGISGAIGLLLGIVMIRYQARLFRHEQIIGRLVGAHPIFFWWPHILSILLFAGIGYGIAVTIVMYVQRFF
jgi:cell division protein FtsX